LSRLDESLEGMDIYNFVRVEVVDTGIGISEENVDKLFKGAMQIEAHRNQEGGGSGFGLLIARKIVEMHDGDIGVTSQGYLWTIECLE